MATDAKADSLIEALAQVEGKAEIVDGALQQHPGPQATAHACRTSVPGSRRTKDPA